MSNLVLSKDRLSGALGNNPGDAKAMLNMISQQVLDSLPKHIRVEYFQKVVLTTLSKNPKVAECTVISLMGALLQCAQFGLMPDGVFGQCFLIPYKDNRNNRTICNFQLGYKGLKDLVLRTGEVAKIITNFVYEGDDFEFSESEKEIVRHNRKDNVQESEEPILYYANLVYKNGTKIAEKMTVAEVNNHRNRYSQAWKGRNENADSPWKSNYREMAQKTVLIKLCKNVRISTEVENAVGLIQQDELGKQQNLSRHLLQYQMGKEVEETVVEEIEEEAEDLKNQENQEYKTEQKGKTDNAQQEQINKLRGKIE